MFDDKGIIFGTGDDNYWFGANPGETAMVIVPGGSQRDPKI